MLRDDDRLELDRSRASAGFGRALVRDLEPLVADDFPRVIRDHHTDAVAWIDADRVRREVWWLLRDLTPTVGIHCHARSFALVAEARRDRAVADETPVHLERDRGAVDEADRRPASVARRR